MPLPNGYAQRRTPGKSSGFGRTGSADSDVDGPRDIQRLGECWDLRLQTAETVPPTMMELGAAVLRDAPIGSRETGPAHGSQCAGPALARSKRAETPILPPGQAQYRQARHMLCPPRRRSAKYRAPVTIGSSSKISHEPKAPGEALSASHAHFSAIEKPAMTTAPPWRFGRDDRPSDAPPLPLRPVRACRCGNGASWSRLPG